MIEIPEAAKAAERPAETTKELEERISRRIGSPLRIVDPGTGDRASGILEYVELSVRDDELRVRFRGNERLRSIPYSLDNSYETLIDGNWRRIHSSLRRDS